MKKLLMPSMLALTLLAHSMIANSAVTEVEPSSKTCEKLDGATQIFVREVSNDLQTPVSALQVLGATYGVGKVGITGCLVYIKTPSASYVCLARKILTDDGGKTTYAQGHGLGFGNGQCVKQ